MTIDTHWFQSRLQDRDLSQRRLAQLMGVDPAAVSLMLRGKRKITVAEAAQLAALLDVSTSEMFERTGVQPPSASRIKMVGYVTGLSEVMFSPRGTHGLVDAPGAVPPETIALQLRTAGSAVEHLDGQVWFINHTKSSPAAHINAWCVVARRAGQASIAQVRRGYQRGTFNLRLLDGTIVENQEAAWSSPAIWARF